MCYQIVVKGEDKAKFTYTKRKAIVIGFCSGKPYKITQTKIR